MKRRRWTTPPPAGVKIDWTHPLTNGLAIVMPFWQGHLRNLGPKYARFAVPGANASWQRNPATGSLGIGATNTSSADQGIAVDPSGTYQIMGLPERMFLCGGYIRGFEHISAAVLGDRDETATIWNIWGMEDGTGDGSLTDTASGGQNGIFHEPELDHQAFPRQVILGAGTSISEDRTRGVFDIGGRLYTEQQHNFDGHRSYTSGGGTARLGDGRPIAARQVFGVWDFFYFWDRKLSAEEMLSIAANPYQIFEPRKSFAFVDVPEAVRHVPVKVPWTKQPPAGTPLRKDGVTRGLKMLVTFNRGVPYEEIVGEVGTFVGAATIENTDMGRALQCGLDASDAVTFAQISGQRSGFAKTTVLALAKNRKTAIGATGSENPASHAGTGDDPWVISWAQDENVGFAVDTVDNGSSDAVSDSVVDGMPTYAAANKWNCLGGSYNGTTVHTRINKYKSPGAALTGTMVDESQNQPTIGNLTGDSSWDGWVALVALWDRDLADAEWNSLVDNPWQIFEPRTIFMPHNEKLPDLARIDVPRKSQL